jgi:hypothetical protein
MLRIVAALALIALLDTYANGSHLQHIAWNYSVQQAYKFNKTIENWLRHVQA